MKAVTTHSDIYPPPAADEIAVIIAKTAPTRNADGKVTIRHALAPDSRKLLASRHAELEKWTAPGKQTKLTESISALLLGLDRRNLDGESHMVTATEWARFCGDLPWWAVERACIRFARGEVRPDELGVDHFDVGWAPNVAQLHRVASAIAQRLRDERYQIGCCLTGVLMIAQREQTAEERAASAARIAERLAQFNGEFKATADREAEDRRARNAGLEAERRRHDAEFIDRQIAAEWKALGVAPPETKPGQRPTSWSMLKSLGWRITELAGEKILVPPPPPKAERKEGKKRAEMNDEIPF